MPWPQGYRLRRGSIQTGSETRQVARRVNRHARSHRTEVISCALRLEEEAQALLEKHGVSTDDESLRPILFQPLKGVRRAGESAGALMTCNDYLQMGRRRRSLAALHRQLQRDYEAGLSCLVPTLDTLKSWSRRFEWQARALLFDTGEDWVIREQLDLRRQYRKLAGWKLDRHKALPAEEEQADEHIEEKSDQHKPAKTSRNRPFIHQE